MPSTRFTQSVIDSAAATGKRYMLRDSEVRGLVLRVGASGDKVFYVDYYDRDRRRTLKKIGRADVLNVGQAREAARAFLAGEALLKVSDAAEGECEPLGNQRSGTPGNLRSGTAERVRCLTADESARLFDALDIHDGRRHDHLKPMIVVSLNTGIKRAALLSLTWDDVDFESRVIRTGEGESAVIPMNEAVFDALSRWRERSPENCGEERRENNAACRRESCEAGRVFPPVDDRAWNRLMRWVGIDDFHWSDMRNDFAGRLVKNGVDLNTVGMLLGHRDLRMTLRYARLAPALRYKAAEAVELIKDRIKDKIVRYWTRRADSFSALRARELASGKHALWLAELRQRLPRGRALDVLDIGTGSGFLAFLAEELGHRATGIDITDDMITSARRTADLNGSSAKFFVMDAESPEFASASFDVIISRNVTWTLPRLGDAYAAWRRLLRQGGVLINFDADYCREDPPEHLPEQHAHRDVSAEMMAEYESIKSKLAPSSQPRPEWDRKLLIGAGFSRISVDTDVWSRVYGTQDEFYNPTPIFAITAEAARQR